jgi:hypothetical protein
MPSSFTLTEAMDVRSEDDDSGVADEINFGHTEMGLRNRHSAEK